MGKGITVYFFVLVFMQVFSIYELIRKNKSGMVFVVTIGFMIDCYFGYWCYQHIWSM